MSVYSFAPNSSIWREEIVLSQRGHRRRETDRMKIQDAPIEPSLWYATAAPAPDTFELVGRENVDVCIIGGGYTGLSSALHLATQGVSVALLEAKEIGNGGSGRNAGHCTPTFHFYEIPTIRKILREPFASRLIQRQTDAASLVFDLIRRYGIDCGQSAIAIGTPCPRSRNPW